MMMGTVKGRFTVADICEDLSFASEAGSQYEYSHEADDSVRVIEYDDDGEQAAEYVVRFEITKA